MSENDHQKIENMESDSEFVKKNQVIEEEEPEILEDGVENTIHEIECCQCTSKLKFDSLKSSKYNIPKPVVSTSYFSWSSSGEPEPSVYDKNPLFLFYVKCRKCGEKISIDSELTLWEKKTVRDKFIDSLSSSSSSTNSKIISKK